MEDYIVHVFKQVDVETTENFTAILWEIWNAKNQFIFRSPDHNLDALSKRALSYVKSYPDLQACAEPTQVSHPTRWSAPTAGLFKVNFDGGKLLSPFGEEALLLGSIMGTC